MQHHLNLGAVVARYPDWQLAFRFVVEVATTTCFLRPQTSCQPIGRLAEYLSERGALLVEKN